MNKNSNSFVEEREIFGLINKEWFLSFYEEKLKKFCEFFTDFRKTFKIITNEITFLFLIVEPNLDPML